MVLKRLFSYPDHSQCDARRPCTPCANRHLACQYETDRGETATQAAKRKHEAASQQLATYTQLFNMIATQDERNVAEIVRWIRSGHAADAIVQSASTGFDVAMVDSEKRALDTLLINLAHSTGSLRQILRLAMAVSTGFPKAEAPDPQRFRLLRNRIVHFSYVENMLLRLPEQLSPVPRVSLDQAEQPSSANAQSTIAMRDVYPQDGTENPDIAPHQVPSAPWTTLTSDDDAVSHLVSLFLAWLNPGWRFVEADIFLRGKVKLCTFLPSIELCISTELTISR